MTIYQPGQHLEPLTNAEFQERLRNTGNVHYGRCTEEFDLGGFPLKRPLDIVGCEFPHGIRFKDVTVRHKITFADCRFEGVSEFDRLIIANFIDLQTLDGSNATFNFGRLTLPPTDNADIWISLKPDTSIPILETVHPIIRAMFQRLPTASEAVSFQEVREEIE